MFDEVEDFFGGGGRKILVQQRLHQPRAARHVPDLGSRVNRKVDIRLPGKWNSNSHGARPVHLIITTIKWIRTSRLSIKNSLYRVYPMRRASSPPASPPATAFLSHTLYRSPLSLSSLSLSHTLTLSLYSLSLSLSMGVPNAARVVGLPPRHGCADQTRGATHHRVQKHLCPARVLVCTTRLHAC